MNTYERIAEGKLPMPFRLLEKMIDAAVEAAERELAVPARLLRRPRRSGRTLRPGVNTPLWNDLVRHIRPHLRKRGSKAQLARLLGVPRQRLQDCLKAGSACLDAERTLMLVGWLGFFQRGGELAPVIRAGRPARRPDQRASSLGGSLGGNS